MLTAKLPYATFGTGNNAKGYNMKRLILAIKGLYCAIVLSLATLIIPIIVSKYVSSPFAELLTFGVSIIAVGLAAIAFIIILVVFFTAKSSRRFMVVFSTILLVVGVSTLAWDISREWNSGDLELEDNTYLMNTLYGPNAKAQHQALDNTPDSVRPSLQHPGIYKLLEEGGAPAKISIMCKDSIDTFKRSYPNVPETFWAEMGKHLDADEYTDLMVTCYARHVTDDDALAMLNFSKHNTGVMPGFEEALRAIKLETKREGSAWAKQAESRIKKNLRISGYTPDK